MAIDWASQAEQEIVEHLRRSFPTIVAFGDLRDIIVKHCPLKPDMAYMEVPRCETCKHWTRDDDESTIPLLTGLCDSTTFIEGKNYGPTMWTVCGENTIGTDASFGCINWEAK